MKKFLILILALQLFSCAPIHFKETEWEYIPKYKGKIIQIRQEKTIYDRDGTISDNIKSKLNFDEQNNCVMLFEDYGTRQCNAEHIYKNGLLTAINYRFSDSAFASVEFEYDKSGHEISSKFCEDGSCSITRKSYDKKNNINRKEYYENDTFTENEAYIINYKDRTRIISSFKDSIQYYSVTFSHDKNGNVIKSEGFNPKTGLTHLSKMWYNEYNNVVRRVAYDNNSSVKNQSEYKYYADKKGNVIKLEHFLNGKLFELTTYDITYR